MTGRDSTAACEPCQKDDVLVVRKLDRMGRDLAQLVNTVQDLWLSGTTPPLPPTRWYTRHSLGSPRRRDHGRGQYATGLVARKEDTP